MVAKSWELYGRATVCYPNFSHSEADIDEALSAMEAALNVVKEGL